MGLEGKTCLVTGALGGIGRASAELFAKHGATVVLLGRGQARGDQALREISAAVPGAKLDFVDCDLSSQASIRAAAAQVLARHQRLDVLFNQAGVYSAERKLTVDGIETMFAVNHLAYFLLTNLLLERVKASAPARVINGTGALERAGKIELEDLGFEKKWKPFRALCQSKLANVLFTAELARRLAGTGVTSNCFHPGGVKTGFGGGAPGAVGLLMRATSLFGSSPLKAAEIPLQLATDPSLASVTGQFFMLKKPAAPSKRAQDPQLARKLWEVSAKLTGEPPLPS